MKEGIISSPDKLHILLLTSWYPNDDEPYLGNFVEQFANAMSTRHKVTVLYLDYSAKDKYGISEEKVNDDLMICRSFVPKNKSVLHKYFGHRIAVKWIKENYPKMDLIHTQVSIRDWWHFTHVQKKLSIPMITTEHGSYLSENQFIKTPYIKRAGIKNLWKKSKKITAVSEYLKTEIGKSTKTNIDVIGNFIPNEWFDFDIEKPANSHYQFLHISTLDDNKNFQGILEACKILKEREITNWKFTIVSEEDYSELEDWILAEELYSYFTFKTHIAHEDIKDVYASHNCFVLNSRMETFSIVNAEALCMGLNLITTKVGFLANSDNSHIDFVEHNSPTNLADLMEIAIRKDKWSGLYGRRITEEFKEGVVLEKYEELYFKVAKI